MQFAQPLWLLAGAIACALLVWQYRRFDLAQHSALAQFAAARLIGKLTSSVSAPRRHLKRSLFTLGIGLVFIALARPQAGFEWQETHRKGLELLFAVDTSKSMLAQDVKPDRLTRAKLGVTDLVAKLNGDGVGLVAFAGNAFLQCPVTLDYDAFRESLDALDVNVIPRGGTNIAAAIRESEAVFNTRTAAEKILVLITDGEDLDGEGITAAQAAARNGVKIFTVGVGSSNGELVPVPAENGGTEFARDERGELVRSRLDDTTLREIAEATGGIYQPLGVQGEGLTSIYEQGLTQLTREDLSSRQAKVPLERFHWALLAALACFVSELLIGNRRRVRTPKPATAPARKKLSPILSQVKALVALLLLAGLGSTQAATPQSAEKAYQQNDFAKSMREYAATAAQQPAKAALHFNTGSAAYKAGDYAQAAAGFQKSLNTEQVPVQQRAYYNLGNTQYRLGQKTEKEQPQEAIKTWEEAVKSYDAALEIAPNDTEAKHNRDLVQRKIDQLKKQEEQKKQDQQDQQGQQDQSQEDQGNSPGSSKDQQTASKDSKSDSKDPKAGDQDEPKDSKDQQSGTKEQKGDSKDQQSDSANQKDGEDSGQTKSEDSKADGQNEPGESKDQKGDEDKNGEPKEPSENGQNDEVTEQTADSKPQSGDDSKDQPQDDAKSGNGEQPKPVDAGKKPSQGEAQAINGEKTEDAEAAAAAAAAEERREPGEMTQEEAKQLLDALKGDERQVPAISAQGRAANQPNQHKTLKDW